MTAYAIITRSAESHSAEPGSLWEVVKQVTARSPKAAVSAYVKEAGIERGEFVAVPVRNWKPIKVSVQTQTKISFE
jgi:hypothetical protein